MNNSSKKKGEFGMTINMEEFYEKYNLNKYEFSEMAHVGTRTLLKYMRGEVIREESKQKIELAINTVNKYNLVRPSFNHSQAFNWGVLYRNEWTTILRKYKENFEELLRKEAQA